MSLANSRYRLYTPTETINSVPKKDSDNELLQGLMSILEAAETAENFKRKASHKETQGSGPSFVEIKTLTSVIPIMEECIKTVSETVGNQPQPENVSSKGNVH